MAEKGSWMMLTPRALDARRDGSRAWAIEVPRRKGARNARHTCPQIDVRKSLRG